MNSSSTQIHYNFRPKHRLPVPKPARRFMLAQYGPDLALPPPWYPGAKVGDLEIVPIENTGDLYREGAAMHHCVGSYANVVRDGRLYVYSVRREDERVATLALAHDEIGTKVQLNQLRGPCNAQPSQAIASAVQRWLRSLGPLPVVEPTPVSPDADELIAEQTQVAKQEAVESSNDLDVDQEGEPKIWCAPQSNNVAAATLP